MQCDRKTRARIKEDILELLQERYEETGILDPQMLMGDPYKISKEFEENIPEPKTGKKAYISPISFFGIPLLFLSFNRNITAKGIIAIGPKAIGVISFGGISVGIISFGGLSIGVLACGGLALALSTAIGGMAIAYDIAFGGLAIANSLAIGGLAIAKDIAVGGATSANLMAYSQQIFIRSGMDANKVNAYSLSNSGHDFELRFDQMYKNFGLIKTYLVKSIFR